MMGMAASIEQLNISMRDFIRDLPGEMRRRKDIAAPYSDQRRRLNLMKPSLGMMGNACITLRLECMDRHRMRMLAAQRFSVQQIIHMLLMIFRRENNELQQPIEG